MGKISFIGRGSAFNTELGNTSAFVKKGNTLLLIDCGGTVFHRLQELNMFDGLDYEGNSLIIKKTAWYSSTGI